MKNKIISQGFRLIKLWDATTAKKNMLSGYSLGDKWSENGQFKQDTAYIWH